MKTTGHAWTKQGRWRVAAIRYVFKLMQRVLRKPAVVLYMHRDPDTREIVYIGIGVGQPDRATSLSSRHPDHADYLRQVRRRGHALSEIVHRFDGLPRDQARCIERWLIETLRPRFNRQFNPRLWPLAPRLEPEIILASPPWGACGEAEAFVSNRG